MFKKIGFITSIGMIALGCGYAQAFFWWGDNSSEQAVVQQENSVQEQVIKPQLTIPSSIVVCRSKQCAPAKLSMSKEYIYNTLLQMLDSNARQKALVCQANAGTHTCTEEYLSIPVTVGITPAYMYIDDVKIADVSINPQNTMALNLLLNWGVSYNGQTPTCRPSKTLLYAKNVNNIIMEDNGYDCKMTTIGTTSVKTMFAIDYIDLDYGYIGGFYSIGLSGPAFGGGSGYMMLRLPNDVSIEAKDFNTANNRQITSGTEYVNAYTADSTNVSVVNPNQQPVPNVNSVIRYNHPAVQYKQAKDREAAEVAIQQQQIAMQREMEANAFEMGNVMVYPIPSSNADKTIKAPTLKNAISAYAHQEDEAKDDKEAQDLQQPKARTTTEVKFPLDVKAPVVELTPSSVEVK